MADPTPDPRVPRATGTDTGAPGPVWRRSADAVPRSVVAPLLRPARRIARQGPVADVIAFVRLIAERARAARVAQTASSLAFLSLVALVPMAAIAFAVLTLLPAFGDLRGALQGFFASQLFPPEFSDTVVRYVNQFASKADRLSAAGVLALFVTAVSALRTIERTLDGIWGVDDTRPWPHRLALYWTIMTLGPLLAGGSVAIHSYVWTVTRGLGRGVAIAASAWTDIVPWLLTSVAVALLYRLLPNAPVRWRDALVAGAFSGIALELLKRAFGWYVGHFANYTVVYGAFAALPAFLLWLFALWLVVLAGAMVAANLPRWGLRVDRRDAQGPSARFAIAVDVLMALAAHARSPQPPMTAHALRALFHDDAASALRTAALLERCGYLRRLSPATPGRPAGVWEETWVLSDEPVRLTLRALFETLWHGEAVVREAPPSLDAPLVALALAGTRREAPTGDAWRRANGHAPGSGDGPGRVA